MVALTPLRMAERPIRVEVGPVLLDGDLTVPESTGGIVLFAHGSGSSRFSPRNRRVAKILNDNGFATLLVDLLTREEEQRDTLSAELRFDIDLLAQRLVFVTDWLARQIDTQGMRIGYFGASTGAAAALVAAAARAERVCAVVSRGGRPDLARAALAQVRAPTLLIVGGYDTEVIQLNRAAFAQLRCERQLAIIPGATHLFEETGALDEVARLASIWFVRYLITDQAPDDNAA